MDEHKIIRHALNRIVLSFTLLLVLFIASSCISTSFALFSGDNTKRVELNLDRSKNVDNAELITIDNIKAIFNRYGKGTVSFSSLVSSIIANGSVYLPAQVEMTGSSYMKFSDIRMTRGTYFSEDAYKNGRNVVVISEQIATKLFMGTDVVGNEVELMGEAYRIVGIYKDKVSILSLMGSDGMDRVYVPYTSFSSAHIMPVETIFINDDALREERFRENVLSNYLKKRMHIDASLYKVIDYYNTPVELRQMADVFVFFIAILCIFIVFRFIMIYLKKNSVYIKNCLRDKYLAQFLRTKVVYICIFSFGIVLLVMLVYGILYVARPNVYIPDKFIPQENIFDLGFYMDIVKSMIYASNSTYGYVPTQLENYFANAQLLSTLLLICVIPALFSLVSGMKLLKLANSSSKFFAKAFMLSCIFAIALTELLSFVSGLSLAFSIKNLAIIFLFYILYATNLKNLDDILDNSLTWADEKWSGEKCKTN